MARNAKTKPEASDFLLELESFGEHHLRGTVGDRAVGYFSDSILYSTLFGRQGATTTPGEPGELPGTSSSFNIPHPSVKAGSRPPVRHWNFLLF